LFPIQVLTLALVKLFGHGCGNSVLVHKQVVPICFVVKVQLEGAFLCLLVI
jgi:hypothetical protein